MIKLLLFWNIFVMLIYGLDKFLAIKKKGRIPEVLLVSSAFLFGSLGAIIGMVLFHHKTGKLMFRISVVAALLLNLVVLYTKL